MSAKFKIKESRILGRGLFATTLIKKGECILEFTGPIISLTEALQKPTNQLGDPIQIGPTEYIDTQAPGVFVNHSCSPNAGVKDDRFLVALIDILPGQEIFFDYSTTMGDNTWTLECLCENQNCRRVIGDFRLLPLELQEKYLELNIVQSFITRPL